MLVLDIEIRGLNKKAKQDDSELYVIAFKELINEAVSSMSREGAIRYIIGEVLPNVKVAFKPEKIPRNKEVRRGKTRGKTTRLT